jgi:Lipase (class 3)
MPLDQSLPPPSTDEVDSWTRAAYWAWWSYAVPQLPGLYREGIDSQHARRHNPYESSTATGTTTTLHRSDFTTLLVPWASGTCRLLYAQETSAPWMPAHFLVHLSDQNHDVDTLHVLLVIRGTSSWAELLWTALLGSGGLYFEDTLRENDATLTVPFVYQGVVHGRVHSYFMECGRVLVQLHHDRLAQQCRALGKTHVRLSCVGHSLGGAVAVMAGLTWNQIHDVAAQEDNNRSDGTALSHICVDQVIALGCPPCMSPNLAHACADLVTTLIHQDDVVPRWHMTAVAELVPQLLSAAILSVDNDPLSMLVAAMVSGASMDHDNPDSPALPEPTPPTSIQLLSLLEWINQKSKEILDPRRQRKETEAVLLPPGRCIQLQTCDQPDGSTTVSALRVPSSYYAQIRLSPSMLTGT